MTNQTCKTCKYWLSPANADDDIYSPSWKTHGKCEAAEHRDSHERDDGDRPDVFVMDGSDYFATLVTVETHSCAKWESK